MKKLIYFACLFMCLSFVVSCGDDVLVKTITPLTKYEYTLSTSVFVQGEILDDGAITRASNYKWPNVNLDEFWESAKFSIKIDGVIVGVENQSASKYWGGKEGPNLGKVSSLANYDRYDDRGLDYTKVDKKTGENVGLFRYIHDPNGVMTELVMVEKPNPVEFLQYWYNKETSETVNKKKLGEAIDGLSNGSLKVVWYVVKEVGGKHYWHVNGVLRPNDNSIVTVPLVNDEVEVDVHLQEHLDWNEIKTSIHVRSEKVNNVSVNIPIEYSNIIEKDDFAIRTYDCLANSIKIEHNNNGITINIQDINPSFVKFLKETYGDGLTIEVHSYCINRDDAWEDIKQSTVVTDNDECNVNGQITSAYDENDSVYL